MSYLLNIINNGSELGLTAKINLKSRLFTPALQNIIASKRDERVARRETNPDEPKYIKYDLPFKTTIPTLLHSHRLANSQTEKPIHMEKNTRLIATTMLLEATLMKNKVIVGKSMQKNRNVYGF
jgi:hypothetical protein